MMLNYTTKISAQQSIAEISKMLAKAGARAVMQEYDDDGTVRSLSFSLVFNGGHFITHFSPKDELRRVWENG